MNKITTSMFLILTLMFGFAFGAPKGLLWLVTIVNNTANEINVGQTVAGKNAYWNFDSGDENALMDSNQTVAGNSRKTLNTYIVNGVPLNNMAYVQFYIDKEIVTLRGQPASPPRVIPYSKYAVSYNNYMWNVTTDILYPGSSDIVSATIIYNGPGNITATIGYNIQ